MVSAVLTFVKQYEARMEQVKQMVAAGVSLSTAIKESIGTSVSAWADKHGFNRSITSEVLNLERAPRADVCRALEKDLGGSAYEWALLMWESSRPVAANYEQAEMGSAA
jgi:hypothetical protein